MVVSMSINKTIENRLSIGGLTDDLCTLIIDIHNSLHGAERRLFMAKVVKLLGRGGKYKAERYLGWNRSTINKGIKELESGIICVDNYASRGRKKSEDRLPNLLNDIRDIVTPICQTDPTFRTTNLYSPITASEVRRRLIAEKGYDDMILPKIRTILNKLNELGYTLKKVQKLKPKKK